MGIVSYKKDKRKKLTPERLEYIRTATGRQEDIAINAGVSQTLVSMIRNGKRSVVKL